MEKITRIERRRRGVFGKLFKWVFVLFNILMATIVFLSWFAIGKTTTQLIDATHSTAGSLQSGIQVASGLMAGGVITGVLLVIWLAGGVVLGVLALATRGRVVWIEDVKG